MICTRCAKRGKTWEGSDPVCGFNADGSFNPKNWNCATLNALRHIAAFHTYCEGSSTLGVVHVPLSAGIEETEDTGDFLILLTWYKSRGRISTAHYSITDDALYPLTIGIAEEALEISEANPAVPRSLDPAHHLDTEKARLIRDTYPRAGLLPDYACPRCEGALYAHMSGNDIAAISCSERNNHSCGYFTHSREDVIRDWELKKWGANFPDLWLREGIDEARRLLQDLRGRDDEHSA